MTNDSLHFCFSIFILKDHFSSSDIVSLMKGLTFFKPTRYHPNKDGIKRLNKDTFYEYLENKLSSGEEILFRTSGIVPFPLIGTRTVLLKYFASTNIVEIRYGITTNTSDIIAKTENIVNQCLKDHIILSSCLYTMPEWLYNNDSDVEKVSERHPEIKEMKTTGVYPVLRPDPEQFPAHTHNYDGLWFGCCYEMWFGKDYDKYIPLEKLKSFDQCKLNETLDNGTVHIVLYDSPDDYASEKSVANAWAFRKHTECDKVAEYWKEQVEELSKGLGNQVYEIDEGKFPHGGIRLFKTYLDENGNHVPKHDAVKVHISERGADGKVIFAETVEISSIE